MEDERCVLLSIYLANFNYRWYQSEKNVKNEKKEQQQKKKKTKLFLGNDFIKNLLK